MAEVKHAAWCGARIVHFASIPRAQWIDRPEVVKYRDMPWETALWMHGLHK